MQKTSQVRQKVEEHLRAVKRELRGDRAKVKLLRAKIKLLKGQRDQLSAMLTADDFTEFVSRPYTVPPQTTMVAALREFFRRNADVEFVAMDIIKACGFEKKKLLTIRTYLRRFVDSGEIRRVRHGLYRVVQSDEDRCA